MGDEGLVLEIRLRFGLPIKGGLVLPAIQRLDPSDKDAFQRHYDDFGCSLIWWFDQERAAWAAWDAATAHKGPEATKHGAYEESWARSLLNLDPATVEDQVGQELEGIRQRLDDVWESLFHDYIHLVEDLFELYESSKLLQRPFGLWPYGKLGLSRVSVEQVDGGYQRLTGFVDDPFVGARLEAFSACGPNGPGLRRCEYCERFFVPRRRGERYGRYCPDFTCAEFAFEERYSKTEYRKEYLARWKRLDRLRKRTDVKDSDKRRAERQFEAWVSANSPRNWRGESP
jgi:hypothetical protein